jgi:hypothetical protein
VHIQEKPDRGTAPARLNAWENLLISANHRHTFACAATVIGNPAGQLTE